MIAIVALATAMPCLSCNSHGEKPAAKGQISIAPSAAAKLDTDEIQRRIEEIFHDVYTAYGSMTVENGFPKPTDFDAKYCSREYLALLRKAEAIGKRDSVVVIDSDHWSQSQDPQDPQMEVKRIYDLNHDAQTAKADVEISVSFNRNKPSQVTLWFTWENGDWKIDNWVQVWEGETLDEKAWFKEFIAHDGYKE